MPQDALYYTTHQSSIGQLLIVASARGVQWLTLLAKDEDITAALTKKYGTPPAVSLTELDGFFTRAKADIDRFLDHQEALKLPVDLVGGTPLQRMVWLAIAKIPFGSTLSYTALAERIGFPRAVRAVASACGANPVPLIIPCHRVLAKDGTIGGFSMAGGVELKETLLRKEAVINAVSAA